MNKNFSAKILAIPLRILNWVADRDANYRQAINLRNASDEKLADLGLTRQQANHAFYARYRNRIADREPIILRAG